jgi:primosomal protein N' (replication factor Y)
LFEAASVMFPPGVAERAVEYLSLREPLAEARMIALSPAQRRLVNLLQREGEIPLERAQRSLGSSLVSVVRALEEIGVVQRVARVRHRPTPRERPTLLVRLMPDAEPPPTRAAKQAEAFDWLALRLRARPDGTLPLDTIVSTAGIDRQTLRALAARGAIAIEPTSAAPAASSVPHASDVVLTAEQQDAWQALERVLRRERDIATLVHGVTGSGKTELYLRAAAYVLARGESAIVLVPEIALSGQIAARFRARFGNQAIVLHSALDDRERYDNWQRARSGEPLVVVGPRSALFAPLPRVGVIVIDEEHESAYKQESTPRYHARAVAQKLASLHGAAFILGSATPDIESYYHSTSPGWRRIELRERVGQRVVDSSGAVNAMSIPLPPARIIDMRAELRGGNESIFCRHLAHIMEARLAAGQQTILFLNRRGSSTFVQCRNCGHVAICPYCDIPLVYHRTVDRLMCHRCGHRTSPPSACRACGSVSVGYYGTGTQRVEAELRALLPEARVLRWDQDALRGRVRHEDLLGRVARHEVDIVVGTQMIAKGLDLPLVTAVGVINADTYLYLPDFRAAERTFQMLTQVAGRAGRRTAGGEVVIQTYSPGHYAISSAASHDYRAFYTEEIAFRRRHGYPPFKRLVRLLYRHRDEVEARVAVEAMADLLERMLRGRADLAGVDLIGPAPAFAARLRGRYGWQLLLRGDRALALLSDIQFSMGWVVDVDPVSLL